MSRIRLPSGVISLEGLFAVLSTSIEQLISSHAVSTIYQRTEVSAIDFLADEDLPRLDKLAVHQRRSGLFDDGKDPYLVEWKSKFRAEGISC